jgi:hypothetical protein
MNVIVSGESAFCLFDQTSNHQQEFDDNDHYHVDGVRLHL